MEQYKSFSEYLKGMKHIPANSARKRQIDRSTRSSRRHEMRNSKRAFSPTPPTPFKPNVHSTMIQAEAPPSENPRSTRRAAAAGQKQAGGVTDPKVLAHMLKLKKWREERASRLAMEKANKKPVFKAAVHVDLHSAVPVPPLITRNHKFKPPANIKPIVFYNAEKQPSKDAKVATRAAKAKMVPSASPKLKAEKVQEKPILAPRRKLNFPAESVKNPTEQTTKDKKPTTRTTAKDTKPKIVPVRQTRQTTAKTSINPESKAKPLKPEKKAKQNSLKPVKETAEQLEHIEESKTERPQRKSVRKLLKYSDIEELPELEVSEVDKEDTNKENIVQMTESKTRETKKAQGTPRRRSMRLLSEGNAQEVVEDARNQQKAEEILEDGKGKKVTRFKTPTKSPKTPSRTPKAKSRKSAGRTPRKCLRSVDLNFEEEEKDEEAHDKIPDAKDVSTSAVFPCENLDSTFTLEEPVAKAASFADKSLKTPEEKGDAPVYVSPFVTMSRGKRCARSEYKSRASKGGEFVTSPEATNIKAAAAYFYNLLDNEIARIEGLCRKWEEYKSEENPPEEACNMINVAIGQSNLLISKKMKQFRALIDNSVLSTDGLTITCTDLHGYWDTVMIQVYNLDQRFSNLDKLLEQQWLEVLPPKPPKPRRVMPARGKKAAANSRIRDAIKAARANKNKLQLGVPAEVGAEFNGGFFTIKSPVKTPVEPRPASPRRTPRREAGKSLLKSVLQAENRKSLGSPGLAMMKASQYARNCDNEFAELLTPTKSILKMASPRSSVKKAVIFKELEAEVLVFDEEGGDEADA